MDYYKLKLLSIDLQRFADEVDVVDSTEDVVDSPEDTEDSSLPETDESEEVVDPQQEEEPQGQTPEENAQFKKMRIKAEEEARKKFEKERAKMEQDKRELEEKQREVQMRNEYFSQQKIWDKADEEGVSEDVARKLLESEFKETLEKERQKAKERAEQFEQQRAQYKQDRHFEEASEMAEKAIKGNPELNFDTAYNYYYSMVSRQKEKQSTKELAKDVEKRTIANMHDGMRRKATPRTAGADSGVDVTSISDKGRNLAMATGVDPRAIAKYVKEQLKNER